MNKTLKRCIMKIGCPKEIKNHEYRVAITPEMVGVFKANGHSVFIQKGAGNAIGYRDGQYEAQGAYLVDTAKEAWDAELVIKVKEPQLEEWTYLRKCIKSVVFCCSTNFNSKPLNLIP